jgi:REP element-mobilizing transposase RayT
MFHAIEGDVIIRDDHDRQNLIDRLARLAPSTGTMIAAWAIMTNHAHILLRSGPAGLSPFMRKLLTGYAVAFNRRHHRRGHLFWDRYKSILCETDVYLVKLIAYIHLNPLRAGLVRSIAELEHYPWSGHSSLMGRVDRSWQDNDYALLKFGQKVGPARKAYLSFIKEQGLLGRQPELTGGGLVRSAGGWSEVLSMRQRGERQFSDERILGSSEFVKSVLGDSDGLPVMPPCHTVAERLADAAAMIAETCTASNLSLASLQSGSRSKAYTTTRGNLARRFVLELGLNHAEAARLLGVSRSAISRLFQGEGGRWEGGRW